MDSLENRINRHIFQMAPHVRERVSSVLLKEALEELIAKRQEIKDLRMKLSPRKWTQEMSDVWHKTIPDVYKAFEVLRELDNTNQIHKTESVR